MALNEDEFPRQDPYATLIRDFLASVSNSSSCRAYATDLVDFFDGEPHAFEVDLWLNSKDDFERQLERYLARQRRRGLGKRLSPRTVERRLQTVRRLVVFAQKRGLAWGEREVTRAVDEENYYGVEAPGPVEMLNEALDRYRAEQRRDQLGKQPSVKRHKAAGLTTKCTFQSGEQVNEVTLEADGVAAGFDPMRLDRLLALTEDRERSIEAGYNVDQCGVEAGRGESEKLPTSIPHRNERWRVRRLRDRVLLRLLGRLALDRAQVCALRVGDVEASGGVATNQMVLRIRAIPTDGAQTELEDSRRMAREFVSHVPIDPATAQVLQEYLQAAGHQESREAPLLLSLAETGQVAEPEGTLSSGVGGRAENASGELLSGNGPEGLSVDGVYFLVRAFGEKLGEERLSSRGLKQWAIRKAWHEEGELSRVAKRLPHLSEATLRRYR